MEKNEMKIEMQETQQTLATNVQLPQNFLSFGEIEKEDAQVYIKQSTYKALEKLAASDTSKELGSILLGTYAQEGNRPQIVISDYIEAKYTDASSATLTFTHETWDYVHKQHDKHFADKKIIGWQHTHPNYGIFLSNYDMFIQENFFNLPFQIAYVIDPVQNLRGFFQWKNGKVEKLKGFYVYDDVGKPIKIEQTKVEKKAEVEKTPPKRSRLSTVVIALLCAVILLLSCWNFALQNNYQELLRNQKTIENHMVSLNNIVIQQKDNVTDLQDKLEQSEGTAEELSGVIEELHTLMETMRSQMTEEGVKISDQAALIQQLQDKLKELEDGQTEDPYVRFVAYTVTKGDSLVKICQANGIDYEANWRMVLAINGITDANKIYVGQTILLPVLE